MVGNTDARSVSGSIIPLIIKSVLMIQYYEYASKRKPFVHLRPRC